MTQTKAFIDIYTKDYPVGKVLKCNMWLEGEYTDNMVCELLSNGLSDYVNGIKKFRNKYIVAGFKVNFTMYFKNKDENNSFNEIIIMDERDYKQNNTILLNNNRLNNNRLNNISITKVDGRVIVEGSENSQKVELTSDLKIATDGGSTININDKTTEKKKFVKANLKNLRLYLYNNEELTELKHKLEIEFFKRKYKLSDDEFTYYLENRNIIKPENIKKSFKRNGGDAFKIKKNRIRKKLFPLDKNDKIIDTTIKNDSENIVEKKSPIIPELSPDAIKIASEIKPKSRIKIIKPKTTKYKKMNGKTTPVSKTTINELPTTLKM